MATRSLSVRHNGRGHLLFCDLHLDQVKAKQADALEHNVRFWFPTIDTSGPGGGGSMAHGLTDP